MRSLIQSAKIYFPPLFLAESGLDVPIPKWTMEGVEQMLGITFPPAEKKGKSQERHSHAHRAIQTHE